MYVGWSCGTVCAPCAKGGGAVAMGDPISYIGISKTSLSKIFYSEQTVAIQSIQQVQSPHADPVLGEFWFWTLFGP